MGSEREPDSALDGPDGNLNEGDLKDNEDLQDAELERAIEIDRLAQVYRRRLETEPGLTPQAYAAQCPDVPAESLLPVLKGIGALARATQRIEGPFGVGERVGPYLIRGVIGRGGMGIVYDASEEELGRAVALKAMHATGDERVRIRFAREARAAARLDHPAIVPVFGSGEQDGVLWYAMRRVEGMGLDAILRNLHGEGDALRQDSLLRLGAADGATSSGTGSLSRLSTRLSRRERAAVSIGLRLADALSYAHSEGVLHRDIKPGNVLIEPNGAAMLTDFGLCKVDGDASLTRDTDIVGTLRYMPPESLSGQSDARGDVYGIGILLLEVLAEGPAFRVDDRRSLLNEILHREPRPLRDGSLQISNDLERVLRKSISKLPEERYTTAAELADDLRAVLEGQPVRARATTSPLYLAGLFVRRNRALSATLAGSLLALGIGAGAYIVQLRTTNAAITEARDLAERRAAEASVARAEASLRIGDLSGTASALDDVTEAHRHWMWRHLAQRAGRDVPATAFLDEPPVGFDSSADGRFAAVYSKTEIRLLERSPEPGEGFRAVQRQQKSVVDVQFQPDGDLFFVSRDARGLYRWALPDAADPTPEAAPVPQRICDLPRAATFVRFAPDGASAIVLDGYSKLLGVDLKAGEITWKRSLPIPRADTLAALSATEFVVGTTGGQVIRGAAGEGDFHLMAQHFGRARGLLAEGGELLASGGEAGQLDLEIALTGHTRVRVQLGRAIIGIERDPSSPRRLFVATTSGATAVVHTGSGAVERWLGGGRDEPLGLWPAAGHWLATPGLDARATFHGQADHDGRIELPPTLGNLSPPTLSRDGRWLAAAANDGFVNFHDLAEGRRFAVPLGGLPYGVEPYVSPAASTRRLGCFANLVVDLEAETVLGALDLTGADQASPTRSCWLNGGTLVVAGYARDADGERKLLLWHAPWPGVERWADAAGSSPLVALEAPPGPQAVQLAPHPDRRAFYVLDSDGGLAAYSGADLAHAWSAPLGDGARRFAVRGDEIYTVGADGLVRVIDARTGERLSGRVWKATQGLARKNGLSSIMTGPGPDQVTTCTVSGRVEVWVSATGRRVGTIASGKSYLRHVSRVGDTGWILGAGGFGRLVLLGHGESPVAPEALAKMYREGGDPGARIDELLRWPLGGPVDKQQLRRSASYLTRALDRTFRYRKSEWTREQKERLQQFASGE